jgi:hypothetical protein
MASRSSARGFEGAEVRSFATRKTEAITAATWIETATA